MSEKLDQVAAHALNEADSLMDFPEGDEWQKPKLSDSVAETPLDLGDPEYCADLKPKIDMTQLPVDVIKEMFGDGCEPEMPVSDAGWVVYWRCRVVVQSESAARAITGLMSGNPTIISASVIRADQDYEAE